MDILDLIDENRALAEECFFKLSSYLTKEQAETEVPKEMEYLLNKEIAFHAYQIKLIDNLLLKTGGGLFGKGAKIAYNGRKLFHTENIEALNNRLVLIKHTCV